LSPKAEWRRAQRPEAAGELEEGGLPAWLAGLLARRGATSLADADAFLHPSLGDLIDPFLLDGMEAAVARLLAARQNGERVAIVGDYDVDGISATALLTAVFQACGLEVVPILPHRVRDGYGFQPAHVERAAREGCRLVVTADCGSASHEAAEEALRSRIDVIVTDHHLADQPLPEPVVEINPRRGSSTYPFADLSGAGLAFKLAASLAQRAERPVDPAALLRVACLGTICDLVPLLGENRIIAALGLRALPDTPSPGLRELIRLAGVQPPFSSADVGFRLGPRLNAPGRVADPQPALELLLTRDSRQATSLAAHLEECNRQRQGAESRAVEEARGRFAALTSLPPLLVEWDEGWHRGVVGIAAGRLAREFFRPTILLSVEGDSASGSGRSIKGVHLHRFLSTWSGELERFGGHAQAVGLTVATDRLENLRHAWCQAAGAWPEALFRRRLQYELEPAPQEVNAELLAALQRLEPFGSGNPQPLLRVGALELDGTVRRFGRDDLHAAARCRSADGHAVEILGWRWGERIGELSGWFDALGTLELDRFRGGPVLQLVDAQPTERRMTGDA
jgi:single-stranded-DNA-specific exonuclease